LRVPNSLSNLTRAVPKVTEDHFWLELHGGTHTQTLAFAEFYCETRGSRKCIFDKATVRVCMLENNETFLETFNSNGWLSHVYLLVAGLNVSVAVSQK